MPKYNRNTNQHITIIWICIHYIIIANIEPNAKVNIKINAKGNVIINAKVNIIVNLNPNTLFRNIIVGKMARNNT